MSMSTKHHLLSEGFDNSKRGRVLFEDDMVLEVNQSLIDLSGYSQESLIGMSAMTLFEYLPKGEFSDELCLIDSEGQRRQFKGRVSGSTQHGQLIIENPNLPGRLTMANRLKAVLAITQRMASHPVHDDILKEILSACHELIQATSSVVFTLSEDEQFLIPRFTDEDQWHDSVMNFQVPVGSGLTGQVVATGKADIVNNPASASNLIQVDDTPDDDDEVIMSVPLKTADKCFGAMTLFRPLDQPFTQDELEIIQILAGQAAALMTSADLIQRIATSESKHRSLVENAEVGLFRMDKQGTILSINPYMNRLLGLETVESTEIRHIFGSQRNHLVFQSQLDQTKRVSNFEVRTLCADGRLVDVSISARFLNDLNYTECVLEDITTRKHLEHENANRLRFLENLMERLPIGIAVLEPIGNLVRCNSSFEHLFQTTLNEQLTLGTDVALFPRFIQTLPALDEIWEDALRGTPGQLTDQVLQSEFSHSKRERSLTISLIPIRNHVGTLSEIVLLFQDETRRKALQGQLLQAQKMESIGALSSGIAHDFNNILGGILGNVRVVQTQLGDNEAAVRHLSIIERAIDKASQLTRQLLGFTRKSPESIEEVDTNTIILQCLDLFRRSISGRIVLEENLPPDLPLASADALQLEQALLNLLLNAADAVPDGGNIQVGTRVISVSKAEATTERAAGSYIEVEVQDSGAGIPEDLRDRIFDPFFTTKEDGKGTGLGLSMVYNIVRAHGGWVDLDSHPGLGTRFRLHFPTKGDAPASAPKSQKDAHGELLLVIDDDDILRDMMERILVGLGYRVQLFKTGREGLLWFKDHRAEVSLVILDMLMPDMNGLEVYEELYSQDKSIKVIFCSGYVQSQRSDILSNPGVVGFIEKPFTLSHLSSTLKGCMHPEEQ
jgi:two-component system, cell cycle sensor histidine kinase and response regulator CckA